MKKQNNIIENLKNLKKEIMYGPVPIISKIPGSFLVNWIPDKLYLKLYFRMKMGRKLNLKNPQSFNEKLQWLKLNDRKPIYNIMVDKYDAKQFIADKVGEQYVVPAFGVWDKFDDIDFSKLPNQFVLKSTHDCGGTVICRDKNKFDMESARKKLNKALKTNYYYNCREWPYKDLKPRIIAEKYLEGDEKELVDYKIFCFDGIPKMILTVHGGHKNASMITRRMYDTEWNLLKVGLHKKEYVELPEEKPFNLEEMLAVASKISEGIKHLRVDLYSVKGKIYFGEMTFYHMGGCEKFSPSNWDMIFGEYIKL